MKIKDLPLPEHRGWQWIDTAIFRKQLPQDAAPADWNKLYTADQLRARDLQVWNMAMEKVLANIPGGKVTDKWDSVRVADRDEGWNNYRKAVKAAIQALKEPT